MHVRMDVSAALNHTAQIQYFFGTVQAVSGATRSCWVYFEQAPPAGLRLQMVFEDQALLWTGIATLKSSFAQGWNLVSGPVTAPVVQGILLIWDAPGTAYLGDVWIDEINW